MIDDTRRQELLEAFDVLVKHNLYRRGHCELATVDNHPKEIGEAIDAAAGAILENLKFAADYSLALDVIGKLKHDLKQQEAITQSTRHMLNKCRAENRRLKALLASHRIKYKA